MIPLHASGAETVAPADDVRLSVAMLAGLVAVLGCLVVMRLQSHGYVPAYVSAAPLWNTVPERVSRSAATAVHVAVGIMVGLLFEVAVIASEWLRGVAGIEVEVVVAGVARLSDLAVLVALLAAFYVGFSLVVFPRYGGAAYEVRPDTVRRQWAVTVLVYGVVFFVTLTAVHTWLPV